MLGLGPEQCRKINTLFSFFSQATCSAAGCTNNRRFVGGVSYFHCPKDRELAKKWVVTSRKPYMINEPAEKCYNNIHFCAQHFEKALFADDKRDRYFIRM